MWWWQSQELAGAFNFGGSVPVDHFTGWATALRAGSSSKPAAAPVDMIFSNSRRLHGAAGITSSPAFGRNLTTSIVLPSRLLPVALDQPPLDCDYNHNHICLFHITCTAWHECFNLKESVCSRFVADAASGNN